MGGDRLLFQIPVYRLSFDQWAVDEERRQAPHRRALEETYGELGAAVWAQRNTRWQPWDYNETVAWIEVKGFHDVVKTYLWKRSGERIHRHPTTPFKDTGKLTEVWIDGLEGQAIAGKVRQSIIDACRDLPGLKNRYIDFRAYDHVTAHLDWRDL
jgi:hypothetical protein